MRKRRGRLARLVTVFLALLVALGLSGMGYGIWSDSISIEGEIETGYIEVPLSEGTPVPSENVTCTIILNTLYITITDTSACTYYYYRDFDISNTGSIPVRIQDILISTPVEVDTDVTDVEEGNVIDVNETLFGTVSMHVTEAGTHDVDVTIETVQWNL